MYAGWGGTCKSAHAPRGSVRAAASAPPAPAAQRTPHPCNPPAPTTRPTHHQNLQHRVTNVVCPHHAPPSLRGSRPNPALPATYTRAYTGRPSSHLARCAVCAAAGVGRKGLHTRRTAARHTVSRGRTRRRVFSRVSGRVWGRGRQWLEPPWPCVLMLHKHSRSAPIQLPDAAVAVKHPVVHAAGGGLCLTACGGRLRSGGPATDPDQPRSPDAPTATLLPPPYSLLPFPPPPCCTTLPGYTIACSLYFMHVMPSPPLPLPPPSPPPPCSSHPPSPPPPCSSPPPPPCSPLPSSPCSSHPVPQVDAALHARRGRGDGRRPGRAAAAPRLRAALHRHRRPGVDQVWPEQRGRGRGQGPGQGAGGLGQGQGQG